MKAITGQMLTIILNEANKNLIQIIGIISLFDESTNQRINGSKNRRIEELKNRRKRISNESQFDDIFSFIFDHSLGTDLKVVYSFPLT
jgi:hypothetical protein